MKSMKLVLSVLMAVWYGMVSVSAQGDLPPETTEIVTSAGGTPSTVVVGETGRNASLAATVTSPVWATVTPVLLPVVSSPSWATAAHALIADVRTGNTLRSAPVTAPTQYTTPSFQKLEWWMLAESTSAAMWRGALNPAAAFALESGQRQWHIIHARTVDGSEGVSLAGVTLTQSSTDGNVLGETISMASTTYSPLAIGIRADGNLITSGAANQMAKEVIFLVMGKGFNGGGTQAGLDQIQAWVSGKPDYAVSMRAMVGGRTSESTSYLNPPALPEVRVVFNRSSNLLSLSGGKVGSTYVLQQSTNPQGPWAPSFTLEAGEEIPPREWGGKAHMFYRLIAQ